MKDLLKTSSFVRSAELIEGVLYDRPVTNASEIVISRDFPKPQGFSVTKMILLATG